MKWPAPPTGTIVMSWQMATDAVFSRIVSSENHACTVQQGGNCWTSFTPSRVYEPYGKTWYWRLKIDGVSATGSFKVNLLRDIVRPRVRALNGIGVRGTVVLFAARMADDRRSVKFRATLNYRGRIVLTGWYPYTTTGWDRPFVFESRDPLARNLPTGTYSFCVKVWDRGGNSAQDCAPYAVR